jgi:hypothetical protein
MGSITTRCSGRSSTPTGPVPRRPVRADVLF